MRVCLEAEEVAHAVGNGVDVLLANERRGIALPLVTERIRGMLIATGLIGLCASATTVRGRRWCGRSAVGKLQRDFRALL